MSELSEAKPPFAKSSNYNEQKEPKEPYHFHEGEESIPWKNSLIPAVNRINTSNQPISQDLKTIKAELTKRGQKEFMIIISKNYINNICDAHGQSIDLFQLSNKRYLLAIKQLPPLTTKSKTTTSTV